MKKVILIFIVLFFITLTYLFLKKNKEENLNDIIFKEYIENLGLNVQKEKTHYLLIPKVGCQGAMANVLMELDSVLAKTNCPFLIITSNKELVAQFIKKDFKIIIDKKGALDLLNLPISNVSVITTENYVISGIVSSSRCEEKIINEILQLFKNC